VQHREYVPGRTIFAISTGRGYGRSERYTIKQYEQENHFLGHVLLDASRSMHYGVGDTNKLEYAKVLAATLAYIVIINAIAPAWRFSMKCGGNQLPASSQMGTCKLARDRSATSCPKEKTSIGPLLQIGKRNSPRGSSLGFPIASTMSRPLARLQHLRFKVTKVVSSTCCIRTNRFPFDAPSVRPMERTRSADRAPHLIRPAYFASAPCYLK